MKRSEKPYPLAELDLPGELKKAWENGWLDGFSEDHFLIKAIENRLDIYPSLFQESYSVYRLYPISKNNFCWNFCINFSSRIGRMNKLFGEKAIQHFFVDFNLREFQLLPVNRALADVLNPFWKVQVRECLFECWQSFKHAVKLR